MLLLTALLAVAAPLPEPKPANEFYGDAVVAVLQGATRVEIMRVRPQEEIRLPVQMAFEGHLVEATVEGGKNRAQAVAKAVLEDPQKPFPKANNLFEPTVGFRLWKDKENVVVLVDLSRSGNIQVIGYVAGDTFKRYSVASARTSTLNALLKQAKEAFPDDAALRQIKEIEEK